MVTRVKTTSEIAAMRDSGKILATVLEKLKPMVVPDVSTKYLADQAEAELKRLGGEAAFLNYQGFPDVICISVNEEVVHGIPSQSKIIKDGDIVGLDFGVTYKGMITDAAISTIAGSAKTKADLMLVEDTKAALDKGISVVRGHVRTGDIGAAIEASLSHRRYGIVKDLVGHGVGHMVHEDPNIPNYGRPDTGPWLEAGMTIAIEPMVTLGTDQVLIAEDGWTVLTADRSRSAHFEHTVLITDNSYEILTRL